MVEQFHTISGLSVKDGDLEDNELFELRCNLIAEEITELLTAMAEKDKAGTLKEACDTVYVVVGTIVSYFGGDAFDEAMFRVHASNLTKIPADGVIKRREDGKILKPDTYVPAVLDDIVDE